MKKLLLLFLFPVMVHAQEDPFHLYSFSDGEVMRIIAEDDSLLRLQREQTEILMGYLLAVAQQQDKCNPDYMKDHYFIYWTNPVDKSAVLIDPRFLNFVEKPKEYEVEETR